MEMIVRSVIDMAHALNLKIIEEGVENKKTLDQLAVLNYDVIQGYYFSRPLQVVAFDEWFMNRGDIK